MRTVMTLGESLIDFVASRPGTVQSAPAFEKAPGGAPANVAVCVARLGGQASFIGKRGDDAFGEFLMESIAHHGVDVTYFSKTARAKTTLAFVALSDAGDRSFLFYRDPGADTLLSTEDVPLDVISNAGILHVGSLTLTSEPARSATLYAVRRAKDHGVFISYDVNWRPALWADASEGFAQIASLYPYCDCIKVNREELNLLTGSTDVAKGASYFHHLGIRLVLITLDADGCYYSCRGLGDEVTSGSVGGCAVTPVDTTGAGDAFMGSVLYHIAQTASAWTPHMIKKWCEFAVATSALVTTRRGAIPAMPTYAEVQAFMSGGV